VERNGKAEHTNTVEEKADERNVAPALVEIEFDPAWHPRREGRRCNFILRHD